MPPITNFLQSTFDKWRQTPQYIGVSDNQKCRIFLTEIRQVKEYKEYSNKFVFRTASSKYEFSKSNLTIIHLEDTANIERQFKYDYHKRTESQQNSRMPKSYTEKIKEIWKL